MTSTLSTRQPARASQQVRHTFEVGQEVRFKHGTPAHMPITVYKITRQLPPNGGALQYRIVNDDEAYERVTTEADLEAVVAQPSAGSSLMERTFGK